MPAFQRNVTGQVTDSLGNPIPYTAIAFVLRAGTFLWPTEIDYSDQVTVVSDDTGHFSALLFVNKVGEQPVIYTAVLPDGSRPMFELIPGFDPVDLSALVIVTGSPAYPTIEAALQGIVDAQFGLALDRAHHFGVQLASTISDFNATVNAILDADPRLFPATLTQMGLLTSANLAKINALLFTAGKLDLSLIPAAARGETRVVNSQAEMLALDFQIGDRALRTDTSREYVLMAEPPSVLGNWLVVYTPPDAVSSVAGRTGNIVLTDADVMNFGEAVQDAVGAMTADSATIDASYNDAGNQMSLAVIPDSSVQKHATRYDSGPELTVRRRRNFKPGLLTTWQITDDAANNETSLICNVNFASKSEYVEPPDDFLTGTPSSPGRLKWQVVAGSCAFGPSGTLHPGTVQVQSGVTAESVGALALSSVYDQIQPALFFDLEAIQRLIQAVDATLDVRFGLSDNPTVAVPQNGIYFEKATADGTWFAVCRAAGVQTRVNTAVALATATWYTQRIYRTSGANIAFDVNGTVSNINTNVPNVGMIPFFQTVTHTAAMRYTMVDWFRWSLAGIVR